MKLLALILPLLIASPASAFDGVGAVMGAIASGMANNNAGDAGYQGGGDDDD